MGLKQAALVMAVVAICAGAAQARVLRCTVDAGAAQGHWIAPAYDFEFNPETRAVSKLAILGPVGDMTPDSIRVTHKEGMKTVFIWTISGVDARNQTSVMQYRAAYYSKGDAFSVQAKPLGYSNAFSARGSCQVTG